MNISDVFTKKIWKGRLSEFPNRRKLVPTDEDNVYDVERHEGEVIEKGDLISNQALNDLENRIQNGFQAVIKSGGANIVEFNIFSYDEARIGTWIDGKPLYRKMFDLGALPNNTIKTIAHNIPDIDTMYVDLGNSFFINDANTDTYSLSHINIHAIRCNKNDIYIQTNTDLRAFNGFTCLNYTKTTDKAGN